ncbi:MAG: RlmE family RNA methyltransferase [Candidatus Thermoplasmatota archaeon]|nr:RlmE family RNA methyltransferase [Candidatus Thermoplasmatota archaeon]
MTRWYTEKKHEHYYKQAKQTGYRARSAFKLLQINNKFKIIKKDDVVIDLGAAPGGWSQVAKKIVAENGTVVGIDLSSIKAIEGIIFLRGDMAQEESITRLRQVIADKEVDVIISDMSPNISGNYSVDQARSVFLCEQALKTANILLKKNGNFICKIFEGEDLKDLLEKIKSMFITVKQFNPPASRKTSSEVYIIAKSFIKN